MPVKANSNTLSMFYICEFVHLTDLRAESTMFVALTVVFCSVWLSCLLGVEVGVEVVEVEGLQWPSLPALGRSQGQGEWSSAGLSTHERMLWRWVKTTAHFSHTHTHTACM